MEERAASRRPKGEWVEIGGGIEGIGRRKKE